MPDAASTSSTEALESQLGSIRSWPARVLENRAEHTGSHRIRLEIGAHPLASGYRLAGQYVAVGASPDDLRYFAIASSLHEHGVLELLVAPNHEVSAALCALEADQQAWISDALGDGFGLEALAHDDLVIFVTGTGIAAVRPIIADFAFAHPSRSLTVYYGERPGVRHAFADEFDAWRARGIRLELAGGTEPDQRFVQQLWSADDRRPEVTRAHYIVVGAPAMQQAVMAALDDAHVDRSHIHFNY